MLSESFRSYATALMVLAAFLVNAISNIAPLYGQTVGDISNAIFSEVLITPANYAFAIWGIIYLGMFTFATYQVLPPQRRSPEFRVLRTQLIIACGAQMLWIGVFLSHQYVLSLIAMLLIWVALLIGYRELHNTQTPFSTKAHRWCVQVPWSIYFGWISVATIVNVALTLFSLNWRGGFLSPEIWTLILILIALSVGILVVLRYRDIAFSGVFIWALTAIAVRNQSLTVLFSCALGAAITLGLVSIYCWQQTAISQSKKKASSR